ncbi:retrotransposable element Tf2, partial [Tanacetum coccineum]
FSIELLTEEECLGEESDSDQDIVYNVEEDRIQPRISLNALVGITTYHTMRVKGRVGKISIHILIDSRSTHNFVDVNCAKRIGCRIKKTYPLQVDVPGGNKMISACECKDFIWSLQGMEFKIDAMLLPLGGCEMVLGVQWLSTLRDIKWNFESMRMESVYNGSKVTIRGTKQPTLQWMTGKECSRKMACNVAELASLSLCVYHVSLMTTTAEEHEGAFGTKLNQLLNSFNDVFAVPTTLPPHREQDHRIILQEGTQPVIMRPYKHPPTQKNAIELMVKELLEAGVIRESHSPFSSPIVMVKKKMGLVLESPFDSTDHATKTKWLPKLLGFDFEIAYKKGSDNTVADALSRVSHNPEFHTMLLSEIDTDLMTKVQASSDKDVDSQQLIQKLITKPDTSKKYTWKDAELRRKWKLVVGSDVALRTQLMTIFHYELVGGHSGDVSMDFVDGLPSSHGKTVILVVVDRLTKYAHFMALSHPYTAVQVAQLFLDHVYKLHGIPKTIVSDRDKVFLSLFWKSLFKSLKTELHMSTAYHPQSDGQTEVEAIGLLKFYLKRAQDRMKSQADRHRTYKEFEVGESGLQVAVPDHVKVHPVFHISQLKKCRSEAVNMGTFPVCNDNGLLAVEPQAMLDRRMQKKNNKSKKESSDDETLTSGSDDEEYAMAVRNFKKFFRRKGKFVRQPREEKKSFRQRDEKKGKSDQKCFRCGDPNHLIGDCPKPSRNKDQKAFIGGSWSDSKNDAEDKTNDETCLMAQSSNEVTLNSSYYSDNASSLDNDRFRFLSIRLWWERRIIYVIRQSICSILEKDGNENIEFQPRRASLGSFNADVKYSSAAYCSRWSKNVIPDQKVSSINNSLTCVEGVAAFFGVPLKTQVDYENFAKGIERGTLLLNGAQLFGKERVNSIALKAKKESSDDETSTFGSDDEEYAMVRKGKSDRKCFRCGDPNHHIGNCPKPSRNKDQKAFIGGSWSDSENDAEDKTNDETRLMAQSLNEVTLNSSYYSDNTSSLDNDTMKIEYDSLCEISLKIINKNKTLKTKRDLLEKEVLELN